MVRLHFLYRESLGLKRKKTQKLCAAFFLMGCLTSFVICSMNLNFFQVVLMVNWIMNALLPLNASKPLLVSEKNICFGWNISTIN